MMELWPFTNFHDLNLDWIINKIRHVDDSVAAAKASEEAAADSADHASGAMGLALVYQNKAKNYRDEAQGFANDASNSAASIEASSQQIASNTARIDNLVANAGDTDNNAELLDIRVGADGITYSTAGNAVRSLDESSIDTISGNTWAVSESGYGSKKYPHMFFKGETYTYTNNAAIGQSLYLYDASGTSIQTITLNAQPNTPVKFTVNVDGAAQIGGYYNAPVDFILEYTGILERIRNIPEIEKTANKYTYNTKARQAPKLIATMQSTENWIDPTGNNNHPVPDTTDYIAGTQSMTFSATGQLNLTTPVDMTDKLIAVTIKIDSMINSSTVYLYVSDNTSMTRSNRMMIYSKGAIDAFEPGVWRTVYIDPGYGTLTGTPDMSNIKALRFYTYSGNPYSYKIQNVGLVPKGKQPPCITFTFDDGYSSVLDGARVLASYGIPATAYVFTGCELTVQELQKLKDVYNWDIELHGWQAFTNYSDSALETYIQQQKDFVVNNGLGDGEHMAYPNGQVNENIVHIVRKYCKTGRTINDRYETTPAGLPYNLHAYSSVGSAARTVASVKNLIDQTVASGGWLILVLHKIGNTQDSMHCSEASLAEIAEYAVQSGAEIRTFADAWDRF